MAIQTFKNNIHKDTAVYGDNVYIGNGQGCGTIWFKSMAQARKAFQKDGIKTGCHLFDCLKCACHYSAWDVKQKDFEFHACSKVKEGYAAQFSSVAEARVLKDTKDTIGWRYYKKTKKWKRIRVSTPKDAVKWHRNLYIKEYRRKLKEGNR